ncbi:fasciclin domain-containing protein [bacterium]|nr:fasciclin domain-containing protein [bacterium]
MNRSILHPFSTAVLSAAVVGASFLSSPAYADDIVETAVSAGSFNTLVAAVQAAGLVEALQGEGPITVFAPSDEAFAKLPAGTVEDLLKPENRDKLTSILLFHVVPGQVMAADAVKLSSAPTLLGQDAPLVKQGSSLSIGGAKIVATDIKCDNGVIHVIDSVIIPQNLAQVASGAGQFNTLLAAAKAAGLVDTLSNGGPFTIFAPSDSAFSKLPAGTVESLLKPENREQLKSILLYHVVPGRLKAADVVKLSRAGSASGQSLSISTASGVMVNDANVVATDIEALNGVIHVIDSVLLPPAAGEASSAHAGSCAH